MPKFFSFADTKLKFGWLVPVGMYLILIFPYVLVVPYLDGNIDFLVSYHFYQGGVAQLVAEWHTIHPPFKYFLAGSFFSIFGVSPLVYNLGGHLIGLGGILSFYHLLKKFYLSDWALAGGLLLATSPLFLANSIFGMTDFLLTSLLCVAFYTFFARQNYLATALVLIVMVLIKEVALIFAVGFGGWAVLMTVLTMYRQKQISFSALQVLWLGLPLLVFYGWMQMLKWYEAASWNDWNFSEYSEQGSFYTVVAQLWYGTFWQEYTQAHWRQFFLLNFQWLKMGILSLAGVGYVWQMIKTFVKKKARFDQKEQLTVFSFGLSLVYLFTVLSFPTYTIPRYALSLIPLMILLAISFLTKMGGSKIWRAGAISLWLVANMLGLYGRLDPLSRHVWGTAQVMDRSVYALPKTTAGNDGIAYNLDFAGIALFRTTLLHKATKMVASPDCQWTFPDPENERRTLPLLGFQIDFENACLELR